VIIIGTFLKSDGWDDQKLLALEHAINILPGFSLSGRSSAEDFVSRWAPGGDVTVLYVLESDLLPELSTGVLEEDGPTLVSHSSDAAAQQLLLRGAISRLVVPDAQDTAHKIMTTAQVILEGKKPDVYTCITLQSISEQDLHENGQKLEAAK
jgi:hypothetical protein